MKPRPSQPILVAEDDADDRAIAMEAVTESKSGERLLFVEDGEQLLDYLNRRGVFTDPKDSPRPKLILLDLNMPKLGGRETLRAIKADARLRQIPVVVLTTSSAEEDVFDSYDSGASSFITKPATFAGAVALYQGLGRYWSGLVKLARGGERRS